MNKKVKCINPKKYALLLNKEYEVLYEKGDMITVVNEKDGAANYNRNLFQDVAAVPEVINVPFKVIVDEDDITVRYTNGDVVTFNNDFIRYNTQISCGIVEVQGVNDMLTKILNVNATHEEKLQILVAVLNNLIERTPSILLLSTNINGNADVIDFLEEGLEVLEHENIIGDVQQTINHNPASDNEIILWVVTKILD